MIKIANFVTDENFVDRTIIRHSLVPDRAIHDYFFVPYWKVDFHYLWKVNFKYIKNVESIRIVKKNEILNTLIAGEYNAVILHSMDSMPFDVISRIPSNIKVFWLAWGYDLYSNDDSRIITIEQYHEETKKVVSTKGNIKFWLKDKLKKILDIEQDRKYKQAVSRVDYFSGCLDIEYDMCKKAPYFKARPVEYRYQRGIIASETTSFNDCPNILVNNSANPTGNHLDILKYLKGINLGMRKIILPLSYSGAREYIEKVRHAYKEQFGDNCVFLEDFMDRAEYNKLIESVGIGIFFHERQQALGNINRVIKNGGKVFLSNTSVIYNAYKNIGFKIYSVQDDLSQENLDVPLSEHDKYSNYKLFVSARTRDVVIERLNKIYDIIEDKTI